jgi:hypothetical protein
MNWARDELPDPVDEHQDAREYFDRAEWFFNLLGWDDAAQNLRRYRSGQGGVQSYTKEEMKKHPAFEDAIDVNRTQFERTFVGKTEKEGVRPALLGLQDGQTIEFEDDWDEDFTLNRPSTYFAFGRSNVFSNGKFRATRKGKDLVIRGYVINNLGNKNRNTGVFKREAFDFNPGQIGSKAASVLEGAGQARPFEMRYETRQPVEAQLTYEDDGSLTLKSVNWGNIQ